ncbi:hypothetical protein [Ulvibacterium sp.]|uniref:hypothetical protein n=1 Tax=Ulvibacterium sp. TaxID=2665914 RepID=UPI003CC555CF
MKKVTVKNLIDFRRKTERTKKTFVNNLKKEKGAEDNSGGGDYWISCLSAISNAFRNGNTSLLDEKIQQLAEKIKHSEIKRIKNQFQRNIDILNNFKDFNLQNLKPATNLVFHVQPKNKSILDIKGFPVEAKPNHVFSFSENGSNEIGAIWFISKLNGYKKSELGMFADIAYRYLKQNFSDEYYVNPAFCTAVDVYNGLEVNYEAIRSGNIPTLIENTILEIKKIQ